MKRNAMLKKRRKHPHAAQCLLIGLCLLVGCMPYSVQAQERFQVLYAPATIVKHKVKSMTVELFARAEGLDSTKVASQEPDYRERFFYDAQGRPTLYEAIDINIRNSGVAGPHMLSQFEYSDNGLHCHRHDSTAFGHGSEWHFDQDSLHRPTQDQMFLTTETAPHTVRQYLYDPKGRLQKVKTNRSRTGEGLEDDCAWVFYVHDNQSFNATSLSPGDMARCQCSLDYLDDQSRPVRRVIYDAKGAMSQTVLMTYDRTEKPIRMELLDGEGRVLQAWLDVTYFRSGIVSVEANGVTGTEDIVLARLAMQGQAFVLENWADWRLLRELRTRVAGREISRYKFSYDQAL
jgi:hypothetical protein